MSLELFNVIVSNISKWFRASKCFNQRRYGFYLALVVNVLWAIYFVKSNQYWLLGHTVIATVLHSRGIKNNLKPKPNKG